MINYNLPDVTLVFQDLGEIMKAVSFESLFNKNGYVELNYQFRHYYYYYYHYYCYYYYYYYLLASFDGYLLEIQC